MASKEELKQLIDALPEAETERALSFLVSLLRSGSGTSDRDALRFAMAAVPEDVEDETRQETAAVARAKAEPGPNIDAAEARRRLLG